MQRVRLQRLARSLGGDPIEHARAKEIDDDRPGDHREGPDRGVDRVPVAAEKTLQRFPDHDAREQEQKRCLGERGDAFDLAVAVMVLLVGGLAGHAHREIGHHRCGEVDQRMRRLRQNGERAGGDADGGFCHREARRRGDRGKRDLLLDVLHCVPLFRDR